MALKQYPQKPWEGFVMPVEITMPKLSDTMTDGTLVRWLKKEGDAVKPGDIIAEVETDKATQELEAFETWTIAKIVIPEGAKTPVGGLIVVIAQAGEEYVKVGTPEFSWLAVEGESLFSIKMKEAISDAVFLQVEHFITFKYFSLTGVKNRINIGPELRVY